MRTPAREKSEGRPLIDVAKIDYWAASGSSHFHKASVLSKVAFLLMVLAAALTAKSPYPLVCGYGVILFAAAAARLPWFRIMMLSFYAAVFTLFYIISLRGGLWVNAILILKSITPALAVLTFVVSTPYPKIFSLMSTVLPEIIASGLFMTYRTLFILLGMMDSFAAAIRLRGGFSPGSLSKNSANISKGLAMLLIRSVERATRLYAVMAVRGYNGSMAEARIGRLSSNDWLPIMTGLVVLMLVVVWK